MKNIFIDYLSGVNRVGIIENNKLVEFYLNDDEKKTVGNIYRGRVVNVLQGMEAAFIDIGEEKNAYLYIKDALPKEILYSGKKYNISDILKVGQEVIVQVVKEPVGNKGAKVTTHIEIAGRNLVFTPYSNKINISRKIKNTNTTKKLKTYGHNIIKDNMGVIFRTAAGEIEETLLEEEYNILYKIYEKIERERNFLPCPKLIFKEPDLAYQVIRDSFNADTEEIIVNSKEVYNNLILMEEIYPFKFSDKIKLDLKFSIDYDLAIQSDLNKALQRTIQLKSGISIVIDETEALTVIDVNTGKFVGTNSLEDTVLKTNIEAAEEIARQIRLRDISGIIIVDFIDMKDKSHINELLNMFKRYLDKDKIKTNIVDITKLGLVELTRKKIRAPLSKEFYKKCSHCNGRGNTVNLEYKE